jgi:hypothetical protein
MARVFSEKAWHSTKVSNINPQEWRPEYAWLVAVAYVDGTFEADPQDIWARAYAYARPDWNAEKVAQLLNEFERVGLLQRTKDEAGRVWGYWTGADKFMPPPSRKGHFKVGKLSLFTQGLAKGQPAATQEIAEGQPSATLCVGRVGVGVGDRACVCVGACVCKASKNSENKQPQERDRVEHVDSCLEAKPTTAEATATPTPQGRKKPVLDAFEYERLKVAKTAAEMKAEYDAYPLCLVCSRRHSTDWLCKPSAEVKQ